MDGNKTSRAGIHIWYLIRGLRWIYLAVMKPLFSNGLIGSIKFCISNGKWSVRCREPIKFEEKILNRRSENWSRSGIRDRKKKKHHHQNTRAGMVVSSWPIHVTIGIMRPKPGSILVPQFILHLRVTISVSIFSSAAKFRKSRRRPRKILLPCPVQSDLSRLFRSLFAAKVFGRDGSCG